MSIKSKLLAAADKRQKRDKRTKRDKRKLKRYLRNAGA